MYISIAKYTVLSAAFNACSAKFTVKVNAAYDAAGQFAQ